MKGLPAFKTDHLAIVSEALDIAEDATGNYYKFSSYQWKRHSFDVKTLCSLKDDEISQYAFALLSKGARPTGGFESKTKKRDFYFICLQDHRILKAVKRDHKLDLLPLLVYVFTHELVHIVRFCNFFQRFEVPLEQRDREEGIVHATTFDILGESPTPELEYVLDSYQGYRICQMAFT